MKNKTIFTLGIALLIVSLLSCQKTHVVTLGTLLQELTNREAKAEYPVPYYTCKQASSYDRASVSPNDKNTWFANDDRTMFVRLDTLEGRKEYVMMDTQGPGAIVRFWMTFAGKNSDKGILRIYFDGDSIPTIEGNAMEVLSKGKLVEAPLSTSVSDSTDYDRRGHNLYLPLPYSKSCKVTYENEMLNNSTTFKDVAVYYNIDYRTYNSNVKVITYSQEELNKYRSLLNETQHKLQARAVNLPSKSVTNKLVGEMAAGKSLQLKINTKASAIRQLTFKLNADHLEQALRSTVLEISFDGVTTVKCPLGDFFGTGYQIKHSNTWYTKVDNDGTLSCFWVMPYKRTCMITLKNTGTQKVQVVDGVITTAPYKWTDQTMYFASSWKQYTHLLTKELTDIQDGDGHFDMHFVAPQGRGIYMGDAITLFNTAYAWWGEGDEKIYVDGETFPSFIGTGTEDYYGYAWSSNNKFCNHPFIAQPDGDGSFTPGNTINLRFRGLDGIPFKTGLQFDMEMWHWARTIINFAPICYWYINPQDAVESPLNLNDVTEPVALKKSDIMPSTLTNNVIEGENMEFENMNGGYHWYSDNIHQGYSNNMALGWIAAAAGNQMVSSFISNVDYKGNIQVTYGKGPQYAQFEISINHSKPILIDAKSMQEEQGTTVIKGVTLNKGSNTFTLKMISSGKDLRVVVDCLKLIK